MGILRRSLFSQFLVASGIGLAVSTLAPYASAAVIPGDTFDVEVIGFDASGNGIFLLNNVVDPTFGTITQYPGVAEGGQTLTITSSEAVGVSLTQDNFTVSVPTNFAPVGTTVKNGSPVSVIEVDIGGYNIATIVMPPDAVNLSAPIDPTSVVVTGGILYGSSNTPFVQAPVHTVNSGNSSYALAEGIELSPQNSIEPFGIHTYNFTVQYATPTPEPGSCALLGIGALAMLMRRRRTSRPTPLASSARCV